jgi:hypothetical protein
MITYSYISVNLPSSLFDKIYSTTYSPPAGQRNKEQGNTVRPVCTPYFSSAKDKQLKGNF